MFSGKFLFPQNYESTQDRTYSVFNGNTGYIKNKIESDKKNIADAVEFKSIDNLVELEQYYNANFLKCLNNFCSVFEYNPVKICLSASLESRNYPIGEFFDTSLKFIGNGKNRFYDNDVKAHVKLFDNSKKLFIILGSVYSTWERKSWSAKTINLLDELYENPSFIVFSGLLTDEFLAFNAKVPPISGKLAAKDLYIRLINYIDNNDVLKNIDEIGLIGFSGGASIVINLLAEDKVNKKFNLGGIAFSPVLDHSVSYSIIDLTVKYFYKRKFQQDKNLTSYAYTFEGFFSYIKEKCGSNFIWNEILCKSNIEFTDKDKDYNFLFYNEFLTEDLQNTIKKTYYSQGKETYIWNDSVTYNDFYLNYAFDRHLELMINKEIEAPEFLLTNNMEETSKKIDKFKKYTNIKSVFDSINSPLYIVFSKDDPILSKPDKKMFFNNTYPRELEELVNNSEQELNDIISYTEQNPMIDIFIPELGSHMGYFLYTNWLLKTFELFFNKQN